MASKKLNPAIFGEKLYNKFPALYRRSDEDVDYALKRFIFALNDGGFSHVIQELNGILELCDPEKTPKDVLPVMLSQYGLNITSDFPEIFMRKLLPIIGDLYKRKGSIPAIEYIAACVSNAKANIIIEGSGSENPELTLRLEIDADDSNIPSVDQLKKVVKEFIPFFCTLIVVYVYYYLESAIVTPSEYGFDSVSTFYPCQSFIPYAPGTRFMPVLNQMDYRLNVNLITNGKKTFTVDPDTFSDRIASLYSDSNVVEGHDYTHDTVNFSDGNEFSNLYPIEGNRKDYLTIEHDFMYLACMNTGLMLNEDLWTNLGTEDRVELSTVEDFMTDRCVLSSITESGSVKRDTYADNHQGLFLNVSESALNDGCIIIPTSFDRITYRNSGKQVIAFPSLYRYVGTI